MARSGSRKFQDGSSSPTELRRKKSLVDHLSKDPLCNRERQNHVVEGYAFDQDTFETLIEYYTPKKDIPDLLGCYISDLDKFCKIVYGCPFDVAYEKLSKRSQFLTRMALQNLGNSGNPAAIKVASETFWGLMKQESDNVMKIQVVANIPKTNEGNGSK